MSKAQDHAANHSAVNPNTRKGTTVSDKASHRTRRGPRQTSGAMLTRRNNENAAVMTTVTGY